MESSSFEENNIIKNARHIFRLKKEIDDTPIKYIKNLFRFKKKDNVIKDKTLRDIGNFFVNE